MGRKPVPTALHKLRGTLNVSKHRARATEPIATGDLVDPPDWLAVGQIEGWRYAVEHAPAGVLHLIDRGVLLVWVVAEDRHRTAAIQQNKMDQGNALPLLTKSAKDGSPIPSPYIGILNKTALVMLKAASELGFTPAARPRLALGDKQARPSPTDPWAKLKVLQGGKSA